MKKMALILVMVMMFVFAGCTSNENDITDNQDKFLHDGDTYTAELFVEMADTYEGILSGKEQQAYVFDLRSKEDYNKGHIVGAINLDSETADFDEIIEKTPSDYSVYVIGKNDEEAKNFVSELKAADEEKLFAYVIEGGYVALEKAEDIDKYISTEPGDFSDFTRTQIAKEFDELAEKGILKEVK